MSLPRGTTSPAGAWCEHGRQGRTRSFRIIRIWKAGKMPARTLTPDLLPSPEQPAAAAPLAPSTPSGPAASAWPALPGLRLIKVPDAAPPYDCETHGAACPATRDTSDAGPHGTGQSHGSARRRRAVAVSGET